MVRPRVLGGLNMYSMLTQPSAALQASTDAGWPHGTTTQPPAVALGQFSRAGRRAENEAGLHEGSSMPRRKHPRLVSTPSLEGLGGGWQRHGRRPPRDTQNAGQAIRARTRQADFPGRAAARTLSQPRARQPVANVGPCARQPHHPRRLQTGCKGHRRS